MKRLENLQFTLHIVHCFVRTFSPDSCTSFDGIRMFYIIAPPISLSYIAVSMYIYM